MEFYDRADSQYLNLIKHSMFLWRVKLELLDHYENTVACIEQDIDYGNAGSITCNNSQGTRKSCSITLINVDLKYIPTEDSPFWFNRKFRLYIGLVDNRHYKQNDANVHWTNETDTYWFSKGVYITQDIHVDSTAHTVSISGIDKYAQLDGTLNVLQADEMNTIFEYGAKIKEVIRDILTLDMGNGMVLDPIDPMIDDDSLNSIYLYKEFTLSAGQYYGDFLNELATSYGAEIFYDNIGRLVLRRSFSDDFPYWIGFRAPVIEVKYHLPGYQNPQESIKLTGVNKIIVATDNVETPNGSYTAINKNPRSPLCYNKIGARTLPENGGVVIINAGNIVTNEEIEQDPTLQGEAEELVIKRCRDYAEYRLMQETCLATSISFSCSPYLHLNEGDVIAITDPDFALDCDLYIINSITFPLGADSIQLEVSNLGFLNNDISSQTQYSALPNSPIKFSIVYSVGEVTGVPPTNQLIEIGENFITATDIDENTHVVQFSKEDHELVGWTDNINGGTYELGTEYLVPNQSFVLMANWANYEDYTLELQVTNANDGFIYTFSPITNQDDTVYSAMFLIINNRKYYYWGRQYEEAATISAELEVTQIIRYGCIPIADNIVMTLNNTLTSMLSNGIGNGRVVYIKYPNAVTALDLDVGDASYLETLILPENVTSVTVSSPTPISLKTMAFNNESDLSIDISGSDSLLVGTNLESVTAVNHIGITTGSNNSYILHCSGGTTVSNTNFPNVNFPKGIKIDNSGSQNQCYFMCYDASSLVEELVTINIGSSESLNRYRGGLELINVNDAFTTESDMIHYLNIDLDNVYIEKSNVYFSYLKQLTISGNVEVYLDSVFISGSQFNSNNSTLMFSGNYLTISDSVVVQNTNLTEIRVDSQIDFDYGGKFIVNNSNLYVVSLNNSVNIDATNTDFGETMNFITDNYCTNVHFYGAVTVECGATQDVLMFICNNSRLENVYFHDDNFTVSNASYGKLFYNNNANFKLHGIANGNVQAFATANNIPFEVIT